MTLLTNLIFEPKGKHDPALAYAVKDTVMSADGSRVYFALKDVPAGVALSNEDYWKLQIDLSGSKNAMDAALASFGNYAKAIGTRVKGETAKTSGNPVTFLPDADSLLMPVTVLEPQQEGSGDPYPAGGGKNLFDANAVLKDSSNWTYADVHLNPNTTYTMSTSLPEAVANGGIGIYVFKTGDDASGAVNKVYDTRPVTFTTAADGIAKLQWIVEDAQYKILAYNYQIEEGSTATEYAPPENIRPFISYDKLGLNHAGKNLIGGWVQGAVNSKGEEFSSSTVIRSAITKVGKKNVYVTVPDGLGYFIVEYADGTFLSRTDRNASQAFILRDNTTHIRLCLVKNDSSAITPPEAVGYQVEYGTVGTEVEPYQGKLYTVQIGQTVYGGKFDWLTGKLVAEWAMVELDGVENKVRDVGVVPFVATMPDNAMYGMVYCSHYASIDRTEGDFAVYYISPYFGNNNIAIFDSRFSDADAFNAHLAADPVQIVYKLATPIEIQLEPAIISAADPEQTNTLYGDGSIEVEYVKPLHVSIEERVAAVLAAMAE